MNSAEPAPLISRARRDRVPPVVQCGEHAMVHAIRSVRCTLHGWAALQAMNGFQWSGDLDVSFEALIDLMDSGLRRPSAAGSGG